MTIRTLITACSAALLSQFAVSTTASAVEASSHWVAAWATALQPIPQRADLPPLYRAPEVAGRTVRQIIYPTLSGKSARVHLSNEYGRAPLVIEDLRIAHSAGGAATTRVATHVTFGGKEAVTIPPGGELDSDPVNLDVTEDTPYAVSAFLGPEQRIAAWHRVSNQVNYVSAPGNHAADASAEAFRGRFTQYVWLTGLSVEASPGSAAIAAVGDSITDGMRSSLNQNHRWPDAFAHRLSGSGDRSMAVVNLGISGNRLLSDSPCYGDALLKRFDRDVLLRPRVKAVILLIGINDINFATMPARSGLDCDFPHTSVTAPDLIAGYQRVIAAARHAGVRVFGATLTPAALPSPRESIRLAVNQWIRTSHAFDGMVDFDAALRDPAQPDRLQRAFDSGDHIHPSDAGYAAMAAAIPADAVVNSTRK